MIFTTHRVDVKLDSIDERFSIIPIGDVHHETKSFCKSRWNSFKKNELDKLGSNDLLIGTGDWNDFASSSERSKLKSMKLHESTIEGFDIQAKNHCDNFLGELTGTEGHWIGVVRGNHRWSFTTGELNGMESDEYYANELGCSCLEDLVYVIIKLTITKTKSMTVGLVCSHGKAGGKLAGTTINQVDDLRKIFPFADIYLMGHDHRKAAIPMSCLEVIGSKSKPIVREKTQWLCRSGSFKRAYVEGQDNYEVGKYHPNSIGYIKLDIGVHRSCEGGKDVLTPDIKVIY